MKYRYAKDVPPSWQWASDSPRPGYSAAAQFTMKSVNCAPSGVNRIAEFYDDADFNTWQTRNLGTLEPYHATNINEQKAMLERRGVPATVYSQPSLATLKSLIVSGQRPIGVGMDMERVPENIRDHPFDGMHFLELTHNESRGGTGGVGYFDANFSPLKGRPDPDNGRKWMPDWVLNYAFWEKTLHTRSFALVPNGVKHVAPLPAMEVHPMLRAKAQAWKVKTGGAAIYETPGGKKIRSLLTGTQLTTIGETLTGGWRQVLVTTQDVNYWVYIKRDRMDPLPAPPSTRTSSGDPAFDRAIQEHLLRRIA